MVQVSLVVGAEFTRPMNSGIQVVEPRRPGPGFRWALISRASIQVAGDIGGGLLPPNAVLFSAAQVFDGNLTASTLIVAENRHEWKVARRCILDLFSEPVRLRVHVHSQPG